MATFSQREAFLDVEIEGINDFRRALARADKQLRRDFDKGIRVAASEVRDDARGRYRQRYPGSRSAVGITSGASFGQAKIYLNRAGRRPWLIGQEWGGQRRPTTQQFPPWRPNPAGRGSLGYFWWPAAIEGYDTVEKATLEAIDDAVGILAGPGRGGA